MKFIKKKDIYLLIIIVVLGIFIFTSNCSKQPLLFNVMNVNNSYRFGFFDTTGSTLITSFYIGTDMSITNRISQSFKLPVKSKIVKVIIHNCGLGLIDQESVETIKLMIYPNIEQGGTNYPNTAAGPIAEYTSLFSSDMNSLKDAEYNAKFDFPDAVTYLEPNVTYHLFIEPQFPGFTGMMDSYSANVYSNGNYLDGDTINYKKDGATITTNFPTYPGSDITFSIVAVKEE